MASDVEGSLLAMAKLLASATVSSLEVSSPIDGKIGWRITLEGEAEESEFEIGCKCIGGANGEH